MAIGARPIAEDANVFWIFHDEIAAINERRTALGRPPIPVSPTFEDAGQVIDAVGLCLSGGGVRSAAVGLGVLQALNHHNVLRNIDYLSTVSGGGYIGCSLSASMTRSGGEFVFGAKPDGHAAKPQAEQISDTDAVGHLRNYSNYLIPRGVRDMFTAAAIVVRGLIANLGIVLPPVLLLAALTVWSNPDRSSLLAADVFGYSLAKYLPVEEFGVTLALALIGLLLFFLWALYRSYLRPDRLSEFRTRLPKFGAWYLVLLLVTAFSELQPFIVAGMFDIADTRAGMGGGILLALVTGWIQTLAAIAAPVGAVVMFFRQQIGDLLKATTAASTLGARALAILVQASMWVAGFALPLLIWVAYLYLCYWGIINDKDYPAAANPCPPSSISATIKLEGQGVNYGSELKGQLQPVGREDCGKRETIGRGTHTPSWLLTTSNWVSTYLVGHVIERPMALLYLYVGAVLFLISWLLAPNANSLHRLYRDRLSTAFLFDPMNRPGARPTANEPSIDQGRDFAPLDTIRLSDLSNAHAPYHLINAALNVQGSDYANRRGRNADFFLFSKYWTGSVATGYAPMEEYEPNVPDLDLATAMAISGAAASSNMGANSIRALTPTLAMLNVRLGYWLKNPALWAPTGAIESGPKKRRLTVPKHRVTTYLWSEITGRLYENSEDVYLTDGGHIENLGIYELLRRRCRVIVAVDAEADASMHFPSLITLQRYARIDLGVLIDLPWEPIQARTLALMKSSASAPAAAAPTRRGPHVAIGTIDYGEGETGYLVYVKSSLTGDENDYIRDYARRYDRFPHESTGDQFFSEEQFEVYRALGLHMVHGLLSERDCIEVAGAPPGASLTFADAGHPVIGAVRRALMG